MKYSIILLFGLISSGVYAGEIKGFVYSETGKIDLAQVYIIEINQGTTTNDDGFYSIKDLKPGTYTLITRSPEHTSDTTSFTLLGDEIYELNIHLKTTIQSVEEVTITATLKETAVSQSPIAMTIVSPKLFERNPSSSIFESLNMVNGVRPQLQCNVCNTGDIHINGMEGPYTMVMIDGMPIVSALGTVYGLMGIPNSIIERVEVQKGPASTLYGSEAVGGLINVITKKTENAPRYSFDVFGTSYQELNLDASFKYKLGSKITGLLSANSFLFDKKWDLNGDNFTDVTLQKRVALFNKLSFRHKSGTTSMIAMRYFYEDRWGGEMNWNKTFRGGDSIYGESIYTNRFELIGNSPLKIGKQKINLSYSLNRHKQNSAYGNTPFYAEQNIAFLQLTKNIELNRNDILLGFATRYTYYDDNTMITRSSDTLHPLNQPISTLLPGIFIQDELKLNENNTLLMGLRYDYNTHHGSILSPRINWKGTLKKKHIFRAGIGNGYRVVNLFSEDHAAFNGAREVVVTNTLKPEQSWNGNLNYSVNKPFKKGQLNLDLNLFYTYFSNKIVADYFTDYNKVIFDNLDGYGVSQGGGFHLLWAFNFPFKIMVGGTYTDVFLREKDKNGLLNTRYQVQTPKFTSNFVLSYTWCRIGTSFDLTGNVYSPMLLPVLENDYRPDHSPWFSIINLQVTKKITPSFETYLGVKNLLNFLPSGDPIMRPFDPFDKTISDPITNPNGYTFDPGYNYAPYQKMRFFLGMRMKIK